MTGLYGSSECVIERSLMSQTQRRGMGILLRVVAIMSVRLRGV